MDDICDEITSENKDFGDHDLDAKVGDIGFAGKICDTNAGDKEPEAMNEDGAEKEEECDEY